MGIADAAERDALQFAAADASHGDQVQALRRLAEVRRVHAERLHAMIEQQSPDVTSSAIEAEEAPPVCPPLDEIRARLRADASTATEVAVDAEGTRAEVTASVAAACFSAVEVVLA